MANDVHSQITNEDEIHVPKGFTEAVNETAPVRNNEGELEWRDLAELGAQGPPGPSGTTLQSVVATDINDPAVLNAQTGVVGDTIKVYEVVAGDDNKSSLYSLDDDTTTPENPPYSVNSSEANKKWILEAATWLPKHANVTNGLFNESVKGVLSESGGTVSIAIDAEGGGDLTAIFRGTEIIIDTTPAQVVALTAGSDISPTLNYVYFDNTQTLIANTTGFPEAFHHKVGTFLIQSAASFAIDNALKEHMHINNVIDEDGHGELEHITQWVREQPATYKSGVTPSTNAGVNQLEVITTAGVVYQMHQNDFGAKSVDGTDPIWVVNDPVSAYKRVIDMATMLTDSEGVSMSNRSFNIVVWGSVNQDNSKLYCNLPNASYNNDSDAIADTNKTSNFNVPQDFKGTGFLIARLTVKHVAGTSTWSVLQNEDLRGQIPANAVGGSGATTTKFVDNTFEISNVADETKVFKTNISGLTPATTRIMTVPDKDGTPAYKDSDETFTNNVEVQGQGWSATNTLTDQAAIPVDFNTGNSQTVILEGNRTLNNPTNLKDGAGYSFIIKQDAIGSRTLAYDTAYKFENGVAPILSTDANAVDILSCISDGTSVHCQLIKDFK